MAGRKKSFTSYAAAKKRPASKAPETTKEKAPEEPGARRLPVDTPPAGGTPSPAHFAPKGEAFITEHNPAPGEVPDPLPLVGGGVDRAPHDHRGTHERMSSFEAQTRAVEKGEAEADAQPDTPHNPKRTRTITSEQVRRDIERNRVDENDPDILASFDRQNPIPLSKITLPDSELGTTPEERGRKRDRAREEMLARNAGRVLPPEDETEAERQRRRERERR